MGTSKHVAFLLTVALAALLTAGQDLPTAPSQAASGPSNTRSASCIVRITVDPALLPLSPESVSSLIHSPAVLGKALREVLSVNSLEDFIQPNPQVPIAVREPVTIRWLNTPSAQEPSVNLSRTPGESDVAYRTRVAQLRNVQQMMKSRGMGTGGGAVQSATVELQVHLPNTVPARADELLRSVVRNLQDSLSRAHEAYCGDLHGWLDDAQNQRRAAEAALDGTLEDSGLAQDVRQRLNRMVDLSALNPQMPLAAAIDLLRKSVEPPLQIVVLWRDLEENAQIEPVAPIQMDGLADVKLRTALEALLEALGAGTIELSYRVGDNVVTVGTTETLGMPGRLVSTPPVEVDLQALVAQRTELARTMQNLELQLAGQEARRTAILEQIEITRRQTDEKVAGDQVLGELERVLALAVQALSREEGKFAPQNPALQSEAMRELREQVARAKIEVARRREEIVRSAGGQRLEEFNTELSRIAIDRAEKQAQLDILRRQLQAVQQQLAAASTFDPEAARIRMAREAFDIAARQVAEWQTRLATLQPPMVTLIGAD